MRFLKALAVPAIAMAVFAATPVQAAPGASSFAVDRAETSVVENVTYGDRHYGYDGYRRGHWDDHRGHYGNRRSHRGYGYAHRGYRSYGYGRPGVYLNFGGSRGYGRGYGYGW